jgi:A/G-specific adenine glycosylase
MPQARAIVCENTSQGLYRGTVDIPSLAAWFTLHHRPLPWRDDSCSPWGVMVSEVMLQQTPVARVEPVWQEWMDRWPTPPDLASSSQADAVSAWGRLGYPRRAMRLHQAATAISRDHHGHVPQDLDALLALPGIGDYTARAIRTFAFGIPEPVVDTNVRRVIARAVGGQAEAGPPRTTADREAVWEVLSPQSVDTQVQGAKALMELGAVVCTRGSRTVSSALSVTRARGAPLDTPRMRAQKLPRNPALRVVTAKSEESFCGSFVTVTPPCLRAFWITLWHDPAQYERALESLLQDGLAVRETEGIALAR